MHRSTGSVVKLQGVHKWVGDGFEVGWNKVLHPTGESDLLSVEVL